MRVSNSKALIFINAITGAIFAQTIKKSIDIYFNNDSGQISDLFFSSQLHFLFLLIFIIDWLSANVKLLPDTQGTNIVYLVSMPLLQVVYGYNCFFVIDNSHIHFALIVFGIITILAVFNDIFDLAKNSSLIHKTFFCLRFFVLLIYGIWYMTWNLNYDLSGLVSIVIIYIVFKLFRISFLISQLNPSK